jgi:beta-lactamase class A
MIRSAARIVREVADDLEAAGLRARIIARDLDSGSEVTLTPEGFVPLASVVKVPVALAVLARISGGDLAADQLVRVEPADGDSASPTGSARFRHPAWLAVDDLLTLSVCFSDNTATDALLRLVPMADVSRGLNELGLGGIHVRHRLGELARTPLERLERTEAHLAFDLAAAGPTHGDGHRIWQLDVSQANVGTAAGLVDLLAEVWRPRRIGTDAAARMRELMSGNVLRHRLAPDLSSDAAQWSSKTGTLLHLRHEIGVVDHADGQSIALVVLSESRNPASVQPAAEAALGAAARALHDLLR